MIKTLSIAKEEKTMALKFTDSTFEAEVLNSDIPVLVDFYADWCGPCKMVAPIVEQLAAEYEGKVKVGKMDVDSDGLAAQKYGIMSIPTLLVIKNGEVVDKVVGAQPKAALKAKLDAVL